MDSWNNFQMKYNLRTCMIGNIILQFIVQYTIQYPNFINRYIIFKIYRVFKLIIQNYSDSDEVSTELNFNTREHI